jgi:hypothetical protein
LLGAATSGRLSEAALLKSGYPNWALPKVYSAVVYLLGFLVCYLVRWSHYDARIGMVGL